MPRWPMLLGVYTADDTHLLSVQTQWELNDTLWPVVEVLAGCSRPTEEGDADSARRML